MPRDALFDAAVNRALAYATRLGLPLDDLEALHKGLELWYLKTRFAYRIPLTDVLGALALCPDRTYRWQSGRGGSWQPLRESERLKHSGEGQPNDPEGDAS